MSGGQRVMSADEVLFPGFRRERIRTRETEIHTVVGGEGPPVLLLHGYPQTHACWHRIAPALAARFTVVCPDLRGYGDSGRPPSDPEHRAYAKRAMAQDQLETMAQLGFERFAVVGHDRGGRVAYRLALDRPERVTRLAVLDMVPTLETWARMDRSAGLAAYHWLFLAQPAGPAGAPDRRRSGLLSPVDARELGRAGPTPSTRGRSPSTSERSGTRRFDPRDLRGLPGRGDRRPGGDAADRAAAASPARPRPLGRAAAAGRDWDPVAIWRDWASDVRGQALPCGHFLPEEAPGETLAALEPFLAA